MIKSKLAAVIVVVLLVFVGSAFAATFLLTKTAETNNTITFSWQPQPGADGYRFYAPGIDNGTSCSGNRVSRSFDPSKTSTRFAKVTAGTYCVEAIKIVPFGSSIYPTSTPPPPPPTGTLTQGIVNGTTIQNLTSWIAKYDANGDGVEDDPGKIEFYVDGALINSEEALPFGDRFAIENLTVPDGQHAFYVKAWSDAGVLVATSGTVTATVQAAVPPPPPPPPTGTCDLNATTANFASQVAAATAGQTVCLASGNYGTWTGTSKAITVAAASGAAPQMRFSFGSGDTGFALVGMTGMGGDINGATNIAIRNSTFTGVVNVAGGGTDGIVFDGNTHNWMVGPSSGGPNAKIYLENSLTGTLASPSVTIRNSQIKNGDLDGIHFGGGSGYQILNNTFDNLCDRGANHTDNMQFDTSSTSQVRIAGNYVHAPSGCGTQAITSYDHGTNGVIIENNVVDIRRPWGIELYSDVNSVVRHNTVVFHPDAECDFSGITCGKIDINRKSADPAGTGTQAYDNLAVVEFNAGSTGTSHHNVSSQNAVYVGPTTFHDGFLLASSSPVGKGAASDGTDVGVYANGVGP